MELTSLPKRTTRLGVGVGGGDIGDIGGAYIAGGIFSPVGFFSRFFFFKNVDNIKISEYPPKAS